MRMRRGPVSAKACDQGARNLLHRRSGVPSPRSPKLPRSLQGPLTVLLPPLRVTRGRRYGRAAGGGAVRTGRTSLPLPAVDANAILNRMAQYAQARFDVSFAALSDPVRRGVLEQLMGADASVTVLAERFHMTLTGMRKHIGVLEHAGLVTTEKVGRVRRCRLGPRRLEDEAAWIANYRQLWAARFDALDAVIEELKRKEKPDGRK